MEADLEVEVDDSADVTVADEPVETEQAEEVEQAEETSEEEPSAEEPAEPQPVAELPEENAWLKDLFAPLPGEDITAPANQTEKPEIDWSKTIFDEDSVQALNTLLEARDAARRAETSKETELLKRRLQVQVDQQIAAVAQGIYRDVYLNTFANDPVLQGNKEAAQAADALVRQFMLQARVIAQDRDDFSMLNQARDPMFGRIVAAMVREVAGGSGSKPVEIKGGVVESAKKPGKPSGSTPFKLSKADRDAMKKFGITEKQIFEAAETTNFNPDEYDAD